MNKIHVYFRRPPEKDRFIYGDHLIIPLIRNWINGKKTGGTEKVFINLCKGFQRLNINFARNTAFTQVGKGDVVIVLGDGKYSLNGYHLNNPVIAGIALMTHPSEWPDLFSSYPIAVYLQHSAWSNDVYIPYFGSEHCVLWPAGIDTETWTPVQGQRKQYDILIYNKIRWQHDKMQMVLRGPIIKFLESSGLRVAEIRYGNYKEENYRELLSRSKAMIFLCEHESQGIACCEAMSAGVPIFAWDQGFCLDPNRFHWGDAVIPATSVPFFDERCGERFKDYAEFEALFGSFWKKVIAEKYKPREYIMEYLTLEKSAERMLEIIKSIYP